jgi:hypothetical protein
MMVYTEDQIAMALHLGKNIMSSEDAASILEVTPDEILDTQNALGKEYRKGLLMAKLDQHAMIIKQALSGSKPAQDLVQKMIDKINMDAN